MFIKIKRLSDKAILPKYQTSGSSGMDVCSTINCSLAPGEVKAIPTGIAVQIPENYELQIRPRSGLAIKKQITVLNTPGTIDSDFRLEVCVILINHGKENFNIFEGDRIAQMVLCPIIKTEWIISDELTDTDRVGGFGSTGIK